MKKTVSLMAVFAITLGFFAFTPAEKNNDVTNNLVQDDAALFGGCSQLFKKFEGFEECYTVSTGDQIQFAEAQIEVLEEL